ncbi:MAG: FixH family protein [Candidatus Zixiibacteriota bacterium]
MNETRPRSRWGIGIAALYGGFVLFVLACVGYASLQHFDLVEPEYYERTLVYQEQIDRQRRTNALAEQPSLAFESESRLLVLQFPAYSSAVTGVIRFYRPSGAGMDFSLPLALDPTNRQTILDPRLIAGFWRMKLDWRMDSLDYYIERSVTVE